MRKTSQTAYFERKPILALESSQKGAACVGAFVVVVDVFVVLKELKRRGCLVDCGGGGGGDKEE